MFTPTYTLPEPPNATALRYDRSPWSSLLSGAPGYAATASQQPVNTTLRLSCTALLTPHSTPIWVAGLEVLLV
jgi:hypothetical protein